MLDFDISSFMHSEDYDMPIIALSFGGGGGIGSTLTSLGAVKAMDSRERAPGAGGLPGLLQSSAYIAGAGTGSWAVASMASHDFRSVSDILKERRGELWDFTRSLITPENRGVVETANYYEELEEEVEAKKRAGFDVSVTDYWARAVERKLFPDDPIAFSSITDRPIFKAAEMPFPIIVANAGQGEDRRSNERSTLVQISPVEIGSVDPSIGGFFSTKYVGTAVTDGKPDDEAKCVTNFDSSAFVVGTSSSDYNNGIINLPSSGRESILRELARESLGEIQLGDADLSVWSTNPFYSTSGSSPLTTSRTLTLTNAGSDGQNLPLLPFTHPSRKVDVIFALDTAANTIYSWPNGSSLKATYDRTRALKDFERTGLFPEVPFPNTFINNNLISRPMFFGCNQSLESPIIIYIPNNPLTTYSNITTTDLTIPRNEADALMKNGYNLVTRANGTFDEEWPACVGCAVIFRNQVKRGLRQTTQCHRCFTNYCWNGKANETEPAPDAFRPGIAIVGKRGGTGRAEFSASLMIMMAVMGAWVGL